MSFWDDTRESVRERTTNGDISTELFKIITGFFPKPIPVVQPTFYLGHGYILCYDYMDYIDKLLACEAVPEKVFQYVLYLRETISLFGRFIRNAVGPIEDFLSVMDDIFDDCVRELSNAEDIDELAEDEGGASSEETETAEDEFKAEREEMARQLSEKLAAAGISETVSKSLAERLAAMYECCVFYVRLVKEVNSPGIVGETVMFMGICVEVQYLLDTRMRHLLLEDVFVKNVSPFSTGILPWISHALGELVNKIGAFS